MAQTLSQSSHPCHCHVFAIVISLWLNTSSSLNNWAHANLREGHNPQSPQAWRETHHLRTLVNSQPLTSIGTTQPRHSKKFILTPRLYDMLTRHTLHLIGPGSGKYPQVQTLQENGGTNKSPTIENSTWNFEHHLQKDN